MKKEDLVLDKIHPTRFTNFGINEELGKDIIALRYDLILPIIKGMKKEALRQQKNDFKKGRIKLSNKLSDLSHNLSLVEENIEDLIKICKKYIKAEKKYIKNNYEK